MGSDVSVKDIEPKLRQVYSEIQTAYKEYQDSTPPGVNLYEVVLENRGIRVVNTNVYPIQMKFSILTR